MVLYNNTTATCIIITIIINFYNFIVDDDSIDDPYFIKAIAEGSGFLKPVVFVMHGPPGAGKTSVIQMLLGRDPLPKQEQNSTG